MCDLLCLSEFVTCRKRYNNIYTCIYKYLYLSFGTLWEDKI